MPSDWGRQSFAESGIPLSKLHTLHQGINTTQFSPAVQPRANLNLFGGTLVAGRQQEYEQKGQDSSGRMKPFQMRVAHQQHNFIDQIFNVTAETTRHAFQHWRASSSASSQLQRPFRFLSVFKWEARKGWDILLPAYVQEFMNEPNVELHIVTKQAFEKVRHVGKLLQCFLFVGFSCNLSCVRRGPRKAQLWNGFCVHERFNITLIPVITGHWI